MSLTIIGGVVGAALGGVTGIGWKWGWSVGTVLGGMLEGRKGQNVEVGQLSDLTVSGSSYGSTIPMVWGENGIPVATSVMWFAHVKDGVVVPTGTADATHLVRHTRTVGGGGGGSGGGGGGSKTENWYTATFMLGLCLGAMLDFDGNFIDRNITLKKLIANDKVIWEDGASENYAQSVTFYSGSASDIKDSVVVAAEGANNTPGWRGIARVLVEDLDLSDFGGGFPSITAIVSTDAVTDGDIVNDLLRLVMSASDINTTDGDVVIPGFRIENQTSIQETVNNFTGIFFRDLIEVDSGIVYKARGGSSVATIESNELGYAIGSGVEKYTQTIANDNDLPKIVEFTYLDPDHDFDSITQRDTRQSATSEGKVSLSMSIALSKDLGKSIVCTNLDIAYVEKIQWNTSLPLKYFWLAPADIILLPIGINNALERVRILDIEIGLLGELRLTVIKDRAEVLSQELSGGGSSGGSVSNTVAVNTDFKVWSGVELQKEHQKYPGFYLAANGGPGWRGCSVYYSLDAGTTWVLGARVSSSSSFGVCTSALTNGTIANTFETGYSFDVDLDYGTISNKTEDEVLAGENQIAIWNATSTNNANLEIIGVVDVTPTGGTTYELTHIRRGQLNSDMTGHLSTDNIVLLSNSLIRINVAESYVGTSVKVRCVSPLQTISSAAVVANEKTVTIVARTPESIDIGGKITGGTSGSILFINSDIKLSEDNAQLFWDDTNNRVGIGTNSPTSKLHVFQPSDATILTLKATTSLGSSTRFLSVIDNAASELVYITNAGKLFATGLDAKSQLITNVLDPVNPQDAATKAYVDSSGGGGAPTSAQYVTLATDATLTNERVLTAGTGVTLTDGGAGSTVTISIGQAVGTSSSVTFSSVVVSGLSSSRMVYTGIGGTLTSSANLTFNGSNLVLTGNMAIGTTSDTLMAMKATMTTSANSTYVACQGSLTLNAAITSAFPKGGNFRVDFNSGSYGVSYVSGLGGTVRDVSGYSGTITSVYGMDFDVWKSGTGSITNISSIKSGINIRNTSTNTVSSAYANEIYLSTQSGGTNANISNAKLTYAYTSLDGPATITALWGVDVFFSGTGSPGLISTGYCFHVTNPASALSITTLYGLYISDLTRASNNYGIYFAGTSGLARQGIWWNGDTVLYRSAAGIVATDGDLAIVTVGKTIKIKEGSNAKMGTATLTSGTVTISTTAVTSNSRIFLTPRVPTDDGTVGYLYVETITAGTSFVVTSSNSLDTTPFSWVILEPA